MPTYKYTATDPYGSEVSGTYEASSEKEVDIYLRRNNLTPEDVKRSWIHADISIGGNSVKTKDLIVFTRMFAAMSKAAVPMDQALNILFEQTETKALKRAIQRMIVDVESGASLSEAMESQAIFGPLYVNMIAAGEQSGNLDLMLERLSELLENTEAIRAKVKGAMVYPAILALIAAGVVAIMMIFVIPQFVGLFESSGVPLPALTQFMVDASNYLTNYWWLILLELAGVVFLFRWLRRKEGVARAMDRILIRVPVLGDVIVKGAVARFTRTLSTLIASGVGILDGLQLTEETAGNIVIAEALRDARTSISTGSDIADPLRKSGAFPPLVTSMIAIGEQSGELDAMLEKVAEFYEADVNQAVDAALKFVEPVMLVVMGGLVGVIMASLYLPMFDMITSIGET